MARPILPLLNMHFLVVFDNVRFKADNSFQSVQGLKARICKNEDKKGTHVQFENIILKRAYQPDSRIVSWCMDAINNHKIQPVNLTVKLINTDQKMLSGWKIENAVPIAWGVEELHAQENKILIETIELSYQRFHVLNSKGRLVTSRIPILKK